MKNKCITKHADIKTADPILRRAMYDVYEGKCFYTGRSVSFEDVHIDHIMPVAHGGKDCIANYVLTCGEINKKKNCKYSHEFVQLAVHLNELIYVENVVSEYINLSINKDITNGMVYIHNFLKAKGFSRHKKKTSFTQYALRNINHVKKFNLRNDRSVIKKPRYYFDKEELEKLFNEYSW